MRGLMHVLAADAPFFHTPTNRGGGGDDCKEQERARGCSGLVWLLLLKVR